MGDLVEAYPGHDLPELSSLTERAGFAAFLEELWPAAAPIDLAVSLEEVALDSLEWFELITIVEVVLRETLPEELIASWTSLEDVYDLVVLRADQRCRP